MSNHHLFKPLRLGTTRLANRIVMAPMTRSRAEPDGCANALMKTYYEQRADAGLIITEGVYPNPEGKGYSGTPGIANDQQANSWKPIVKAVHDKGGKIAIQLMHCGRIAHPDNRFEKANIVAPSAIRARGEIFTAKGMQPFVEPEALDLAGILQTIHDYKQATARALHAGFDLVELHCTSGYLPAQFLSTGTNQRTDAYGGTLEKRLRFVLEVVEAMSTVKGADKIGLRICPGNPFNDLFDEAPKATFTALLEALSAFDLAYLHVIRSPVENIDVFSMMPKDFADKLIINDGFNITLAEKVLTDNQAAAVSFGRDFIANPDLVSRLKLGLPLSTFNPKTLYTQGAHGYIDYPTA